MKAKDWAAKLAASPDNRDELLRAFVAEIGSVAQLRGGSLNAVEGAVREQRAKWQAVCRECPSVDPGLFASMLATYGSEYKKAEETAQSQAAGRGQDDQEGMDRAGAGRRRGSWAKKGGRGYPA
jgi:hypothetical protein